MRHGFKMRHGLIDNSLCAFIDSLAIDYAKRPKAFAAYSRVSVVAGHPPGGRLNPSDPGRLGDPRFTPSGRRWRVAL